jgi:threonine dehydratase
MVQVSEREIARAVGAYADAGIRTEGAAAAALAAVPQLDDLGDPLVLIVTGRNIDDDLFKRAHEEPESFPD